MGIDICDIKIPCICPLMLVWYFFWCGIPKQMLFQHMIHDCRVHKKSESIGFSSEPDYGAWTVSSELKHSGDFMNAHLPRFFVPTFGWCTSEQNVQREQLYGVLMVVSLGNWFQPHLSWPNTTFMHACDALLWHISLVEGFQTARQLVEANPKHIRINNVWDLKGYIWSFWNLSPKCSYRWVHSLFRWTDRYGGFWGPRHPAEGHQRKEAFPGNHMFHPQPQNNILSFHGLYS